MLYLLLAFLVAFLVCYLLIKNADKIFLDCKEGVQKFHQWNAIRVGGLSIILSLFATSGAFLIGRKDFASLHFYFILSTLPVFLGGFLEDLTKKVGAKQRLLGGIVSGLLAYFLLDIHLNRVDIPGFDWILSNFLLFSVIFTSFALAGVSNSVNIIDGFNGLASGVAIMVFLAYSYVSYLVGDFFLLYTSLTIVGALLGFFFWNFPFGYIFLGDGGAYLLGFLSGLIGVLLVERNQEVSAWFPFLLLIYPIYETLFSIVRRKFLRSFSPFEADAIHLHTLIHRRVIKLTLGNKIPKFLLNSFTSPYLWFMQILGTIPAVLFWKKTYILMIFSLAFIVFYTWLYFRIIRFKTPYFMQVPVRVIERSKD